MLHIADHVLELDGCVLDAELLPQPLLHLAQDTFADRGRNVFYSDVARECMQV